MGIMKKTNYKRKHFISYLSQVETFSKPKFKLEQYCTSVEHTMELFERLHTEFEAIEGKIIGDFCCGTGMYSIAAQYFDAEKTVAFDLDPDALSDAMTNVEFYELNDQ